MLSRWVTNSLAVVVIIAWFGSWVMSCVDPKYHAPESVEWTISILAGAAFTGSAVGFAVERNKPKQ